MTEINMCKAKKAFQRKAKIVPASKASSKRTGRAQRSGSMPGGRKALRMPWRRDSVYAL